MVRLLIRKRSSEAEVERKGFVVPSFTDSTLGAGKTVYPSRDMRLTTFSIPPLLIFQNLSHLQITLFTAPGSHGDSESTDTQVT